MEVARIQDAQARLQEIAVEAGQMFMPDLAAAAAAASTFTPAQAASEDEQGPVTVTVHPLPHSWLPTGLGFAWCTEAVGLRSACIQANGNQEHGP